MPGIESEADMMLRGLFIAAAILTNTGTSLSGEIVVMECPCCGRVSEDMTLFNPDLPGGL